MSSNNQKEDKRGVMTCAYCLDASIAAGKGNLLQCNTCLRLLHEPCALKWFVMHSLGEIADATPLQLECMCGQFLNTHLYYKINIVKMPWWSRINRDTLFPRWIMLLLWLYWCLWNNLTFHIVGSLIYAIYLYIGDKPSSLDHQINAALTFITSYTFLLGNRTSHVLLKLAIIVAWILLRINRDGIEWYTTHVCTVGAALILYLFSNGQQLAMVQLLLALFLAAVGFDIYGRLKRRHFKKHYPTDDVTLNFQFKRLIIEQFDRN